MYSFWFANKREKHTKPWAGGGGGEMWKKKKKKKNCTGHPEPKSSPGPSPPPPPYPNQDCAFTPKSAAPLKKVRKKWGCFWCPYVLFSFWRNSDLWVKSGGTKRFPIDCYTRHISPFSILLHTPLSITPRASFQFEKYWFYIERFRLFLDRREADI